MQDNLSPQQLQMFTPARELMATPSADIHSRSRYKDHDDMWAQKRRDNAADGLTDHVARSGVHAPVTLVTGDDLGSEWRIEDGHHRIAAGYETDPSSEIPVQHKDYDNRVRQSNSVVEENFNQGAPDWDPQDSYQKRVEGLYK